MPLSTIDTSSISGLGYGFKNRIINGAMMIDQRNAGAATANTINGYTLDRWSVVQSTTGKLIVQQNAGAITPPVGFSNYLGITSQSAYSVGSGDYYFGFQRIEGYNTADLAWGTASAAPVVLSFWVRSSLTGTFGGALQNSGLSRSYPFTYTISSANTWEQKTINIAGDTSGTWLATNGIGLQVNFGVGVGSTYSGTAGSWAGANYASATGATSVVGTNGATFYITGVQLEKGTVATSFDYRPYGTELALCQRYCFVPSSDTGGCAYNSTTFYAQLKFPVFMRAAPSSTYGSASGYTVYINNSGTAPSAVATDSPALGGLMIAATGTYTAGQGGFIRMPLTIYSAEL